MDNFNCPNCGIILEITSNLCYNCSYDVSKISEIIKKGDIYFGLEKFPEAFDCYEKALKIDSKNSLVWIRKGNVFLRQGSEAERNKSNKKCIICPVLSEVFYEDAIKCYNKAIEINPEFKEALDPELLGFLGYVHNIGYAIQADKHELHTVYILVNKEGIPQAIAERTKHGHLVEKHPESQQEYYPLGLEGIILTYVDIMVSKEPNISFEARVSEIKSYVKTIELIDDKKEEFLRNFLAAVPRYKRYESIINALI